MQCTAYERGDRVAEVMDFDLKRNTATLDRDATRSGIVRVSLLDDNGQGVAGDCTIVGKTLTMQGRAEWVSGKGGKS